MSLAKLGLVGLLCGSVMACSPKMQKIVLSEKEIPKGKTEYANYVFTPADSNHVKRADSDFGQYHAYSLAYGLDLDGIVFGMNIEDRETLQEYNFTQANWFLKQVHMPELGIIQNHTHFGYIADKKDTKQLAISAKYYKKEGFYFLDKMEGAMGMGGGAKLYLNSRDVLLVDSTTAEKIHQVSIKPTISFYSQLYFNESKNGGIKITFDADILYPPTVQIYITFVMGLD